MEKISKILPSSARLQGVDMARSAPIRPGTPTFGRPVGLSTLAQNQRPRTSELAHSAHEGLMKQRNVMDKDAAIVQKMSDAFFMRKRTSAPATPPPSAVADLQTLKVPGVNTEPRLNSSAEELSTPEELLDRPEVGGFLDIEA